MANGYRNTLELNRWCRSYRLKNRWILTSEEAVISESLIFRKA